MELMESDEARDVRLLWERLGGELRTWLQGQLREDPHAVEDLLQECFLRVHRGLAGLQDLQQVGPWVQRIAQNLVIDWRRKRAGLAGQAPGDQADLGELAADASRDDAGQGAVVASWLVPAIDNLPPEDRALLRMTEVEGRTQLEAARELGLSLPALKSRVLRARARLRADILACCHLEFDARGGILDYRQRAANCASCDGAS